MKKFGVGIFVLALIGLLLFFTKPSEENFREWINSDWVQRELKSNANLQDALNKDFKLTPDQKIVYEDNYIYSNVFVKIGGKEQKFFGIIGNWLYTD
jgi:hypothetical protein